MRHSSYPLLKPAFVAFFCIFSISFCFSQLLQDGSFEMGTPNSNWSESSTNFGSPICSNSLCGNGGGSGANSGQWWAWFGGAPVHEESVLSQTLLIPTHATTLEFYLEIPSCDHESDYFEIVLDDLIQLFHTTGADSNCAVLGYRPHVIPLTGFANGQTHTITFRGEIFGTNNSATNFFIDDVAINLSTALQSDAALVDVVPLTTEYTMIPLNQVRAFPLEATVENVGTDSLSGISLTVNIHKDNYPNPVLPSLSGDTLGNLLSGANTQLSVPAGFVPSEAGHYILEYVVSSNEIDGNPSNSTIFSVLTISDSTYARDESFFELNTNFPSTGGGAGHEFDIFSGDYLSSVSVGINANIGAIGESVTASIWEMSGGVPTSVIATSDAGIIAESGTANFSLKFSGDPVFLDSGTYSVIIEKDSGGGDWWLTASSSIITASRNWTSLDLTTWSSGADSAAFNVRANFSEPECSELTGPSTTGISPTSATLSWNEVAGADHYVLQGNTQGSPVDGIELNVGNITSFNATGLLPNTSYIWRVQAYCDADGNFLSGWSDIQTFSTTSECFQPAPISTTNITATTATLNWEMIAATHHYRIRGNVLGFPPNITLTVNDGAQNSLNLTGLSANTSYHWQIKAFCNAAETYSSPWTPLDTFTTSQDCSKPMPISTDNITFTTARLNWTAVANASGYIIEGGEVGGPYLPGLPISNPNTVWFNALGLTQGTSYEWRIKTICDPFGESGYTPFEQFTTFGSKTDRASEINNVSLNVEITPNPARNFIRISIPNSMFENSYDLTLYDIAGKLVFEQKRLLVSAFNPTIISTNDLPDGIYEMQLKGVDFHKSEKLVISK